MERNELAIKVIESHNALLAQVARCLSVKEQERIALAVFNGIPNVIIPDTRVIDGIEYTFKSYNWLTGIVEYTYINKVIKYFETQEEADYVVKNHSTWQGWEKADDKHNIKAEIERVIEDTCSLETWLKEE